MSLRAVVIPLVQECLSEEASCYTISNKSDELTSDQFSTELDEPGLRLWQTSLQHSTSLKSVNGLPTLVDLLPLAVRLLGSCPDLLGRTIDIVESYVLLGATDILQVRALATFILCTC